MIKVKLVLNCLAGTQPNSAMTNHVMKATSIYLPKKKKDCIGDSSHLKAIIHLMFFSVCAYSHNLARNIFSSRFVIHLPILFREKNCGSNME